MCISQNDLVRNTKTAVDTIPLKLGVNKRNEVSRLLYEICLIKNILPKNLLSDILPSRPKKIQFKYLKKELIVRRHGNLPYPYVLGNSYLPPLPKSRRPGFRYDPFYPENIFYEPGLGSTVIFNRAVERYPKSKKEMPLHKRTCIV